MGKVYKPKGMLLVKTQNIFRAEEKGLTRAPGFVILYLLGGFRDRLFLFCKNHG